MGARAPMFEVVNFTDKTFGIMQSKTGYIAGENGKPISFKQKGAAVLKCQEMNAAVNAKKDELEKEN